MLKVLSVVMQDVFSCFTDRSAIAAWRHPARAPAMCCSGIVFAKMQSAMRSFMVQLMYEGIFELDDCST